MTVVEPPPPASGPSPPHVRAVCLPPPAHRLLQSRLFCHCQKQNRTVLLTSTPSPTHPVFLHSVPIALNHAPTGPQSRRQRRCPPQPGSVLPRRCGSGQGPGESTSPPRYCRRHGPPSIPAHRGDGPDGPHLVGCRGGEAATGERGRVNFSAGPCLAPQPSPWPQGLEQRRWRCGYDPKRSADAVAGGLQLRGRSTVAQGLG